MGVKRTGVNTYLVFFFYIIWILMLTMYITSYMGDDGMNLEAREQQTKYWGHCTELKCRIDDVKDGRSFLAYLEEVIIPKTFSETDEYKALTWPRNEIYGPDVTNIDQALGAIANRGIYTLEDKSVPWAPRWENLLIISRVICYVWSWMLQYHLHVAFKI